MLTKQLHLAKWMAAPAFLGLATFASAQSSPTQRPAQDSDSARSMQDRDSNRDQLARFDQFLDSHREIAEQLQKDPSLANNRQFLKSHPPLQAYLQDHPETREALKTNAQEFMSDEARFERSGADRNQDRDRDTNRRELANFDHFLDSHRQIDQQLRRDPSLVDNRQYLKDHPELQSYLQDHPQVRDELKQNTDAFMRAENRYDRQEDSHDLDRGREREIRELRNFDQFLDSHREISEQLHKNPALADNQQFLKDHPALQSYMQDHPVVRDYMHHDPSTFMKLDDLYGDNRGTTADRGTIPDQDRNGNFDRDRDANRDRDAMDRDRGNGDDRTRNDDRNRSNGMDRDRGNDFDRDRDAHRHFGEFLANHGDIAQQLSNDPSSVKRQDYLRDHPELQEYLNQHPEVRQPLMADPQHFVTKSTQQFNNGQPATKTPATTAPTLSPTGTPKPNKQ